MMWREGRPVGRELLLVEDNPGDADLVREILGEEPAPGENIEHVLDLAGALALLAARRFDAVLLDIRLPDGAGVECVAAIRASAATLPIIVLTGTNDDQLAYACLAAGAQDYLSKGAFDAQNLRRSIGYAIARTEVIEARRHAAELRERLAAIVTSSSDAIISCSLEGLITSWNRGAERIFGFTAAEAEGQPVTACVRAVDDSNLPLLARTLSRGREGVDSSESVLIERLRKDGSRVWLSAVVCNLRNAGGKVIEVAAICRDVTAIRHRDEELRRRSIELEERGVQMRALTARLNATREDERTRISREVHDGLGQLLTGLKMDLRWVNRRLGGVPAAAEIAARLREAETLVDATVTRVQEIAVELRPSALDTLGLAAAVRDEARRFESRCGIPATLVVKGISEPHREVATALFRIFQELLANIARHARASSVRVALAESETDWELRVEDDGVGLPPEAERRRNSLGLLGMRERAEELGGAVSLNAGVDGGTVARVTVPRKGPETGHAKHTHS